MRNFDVYFTGRAGHHVFSVDFSGLKQTFALRAFARGIVFSKVFDGQPEIEVFLGELRFDEAAEFQEEILISENNLLPNYTFDCKIYLLEILKPFLSSNFEEFCLIAGSEKKII